MMQVHSFVATLVIATLAVACVDTDAAITERVKNKLETDETVKTRPITVSSTDKVVTLSGSVDSPAARDRAVTLARETPGVTRVDDRLTVTAPATDAPLPTGPPDATGTTSPPMPGAAMGLMGIHHGEMGTPPEGMMRESGGGGMSSPSPPGSASVPAMVPLSALPGTPGVSHLYHIGATGFFLDQPQIRLTADQQATLGQLKDRAVRAREDAQRRITQAEQELWELTGAEADPVQIERKVQEIERLRTNQRLEFIRTVGEATQALTRAQQTLLLGTNSSK